MDIYAEQALAEYNNEANVIRQGGINGKNFWNLHSSQFIYAPAFYFPDIPGANSFEFVATDNTAQTHSFTSNCSYANLSPIWKDIPVGMVELKVYATHGITGVRYLAGARTFYKAPPFPGREALPPKASPYSEAALKAFRYAFNSSESQYWLHHGKPDPDYYHNVYPSKMISSLVKAMIAYAELEPEMAESAIKLAVNAADYLLSITYGKDTAVEGLPPTYSFEGLNKKIVDATAPMADKRQGTIMLIYPADVGVMYLELEKATGNKKYFDAAQKIAEYYKENVLPNGSWYLLVHTDTNKSDSDNCCCTFSILNFLSAYYKRTNDECYHALEKNFFEYINKTRLETFNWEGQFEDINLSSNFTNLTHFIAGDYVEYISNNFDKNQDKLETAKELMRFIEDQFVVWGKFAPWRKFAKPDDVWYSPAALEQYDWCVPIDSSTAKVLDDFLCIYKITGDKLLLEKACALGDSITRRQNPKNGVIPTHWMKADCAENLENFWINCHIYSAFTLLKLAKMTGEI